MLLRLRRRLEVISKPRFCPSTRPRLVFFHHTLMFVDRVDYLRPEIATDLIMAIDALVQPFN